MSFLNSLPLEFSLPKKVRNLICCDLDETYIPFDDAKKSKGGVKELEDFICSYGEEKGIVIGWITGTNLSSIFRKSHNYISKRPHFICCSLGTEFYWLKDGKPVSSQRWEQKIINSGFSRDKIETLVKQASDKNIELIKQPQDYQAKFKISYYYHISAKINDDFNWLKAQAEQSGCRVILTKSNPAAGDPQDAYDVEFIPKCCGKDKAVLFLIEEFNLAKENVYAFGDSCNDFPMFSTAGNGYLVANADPKALELYDGKHLDKAYCSGILSILQGLK